ncbi:META domain-containing protein [Variovorax paradoxus]|uniref:META domain-containing protein n=1 Tax=Variovorax paradoxus TaxID=34073 RepID=A0A6I6HNZ5_VARPD|nr:META domain-containing protein [Variovorax paradoxus]QGW84639.1 META domain-containing protein [Variovorax paradoxus]
MRFLARHRARLALPVFAAVILGAVLSGCGSGISLDEPIEGPVWRLAQLGNEPVAPGGDAQIQFDRSSGRVSGSGGCNRVSGSFTRSGSALRIGQLASTRMACADPVRGANEAQFISALQTTATYRLAGPGRLALLDASGRTVATLNSTSR